MSIPITPMAIIPVTIIPAHEMFKSEDEARKKAPAKKRKS